VGSGGEDSIRLWNDATDTVHERGGRRRPWPRWPAAQEPALALAHRQLGHGGRLLAVISRAREVSTRQPSGWRLDDQLAAPIPSSALEGDGLLAQTKGPCASDIYSGDPVAQHITPP